MVLGVEVDKWLHGGQKPVGLAS
jgi:hypothetical protein